MGVRCILLNLFIYPGVRFSCVVMQFGSVFVALFNETKTERVQVAYIERKTKKLQALYAIVLHTYFWK